MIRTEKQREEASSKAESLTKQLETLQSKISADTKAELFKEGMQKARACVVKWIQARGQFNNEAIIAELKDIKQRYGIPTEEIPSHDLSYASHYPNFSHLDLSGLDFSGLSFKQAHFQHAKLVQTKFVGCFLERCQFQGADLTEANLTNIQFAQGGLANSGTQLNFYQATLTRAIIIHDTEVIAKLEI